MTRPHPTYQRSPDGRPVIPRALPSPTLPTIIGGRRPPRSGIGGEVLIRRRGSRGGPGRRIDQLRGHRRTHRAAVLEAQVGRVAHHHREYPVLADGETVDVPTV